MFEAGLARLDNIFRQYLVSHLPAKYSIGLYSYSRPYFLSGLVKARPQAVEVPEQVSRTLWGLKFRSPLFNAAGMFKSGEGYELCYLQGAGAFLAGTSTSLARIGNKKLSIKHPFVPYPNSFAASNFLGLPNPGEDKISSLLEQIERKPNFPLGISISGDPALEGKDKLEKLVQGLHLYQRSKVDFIELNESCPNTEEASSKEGLIERLQFISDKFLKSETRSAPVIVKFSVDTPLEVVPTLLNSLLNLGFDGVNFGNTSVDYKNMQSLISAKDLPAYKFFTENFGGGVSGFPLKNKSLALIKEAKKFLEGQTTSQEFHIVRTGGVENWQDVQESLQAGASLVQWYTGYFEQFAKNGHSLYAKLYQRT